MTSLITTFHLSPAIAFDLARPKLRLAMRHFDEKEAAEQDAKRKKGLLEKLQREKKAASSNAGSSEEGEAKTTVDTVVVNGEDVKMEDVKSEDVKMEDLEAAAGSALIETNGEETPRSGTPVVGSVSSPAAFVDSPRSKSTHFVRSCAAVASRTCRSGRKDGRDSSRRGSVRPRVSPFACPCLATKLTSVSLLGRLSSSRSGK